MGAKGLSIKNKAFYLPTKMINIWDFDPKKLEIHKEGSDDIGIYYIRYDVDPFYLTIDDVYGYFEENDENGSKYLNLVFCNEDQDVTYLKYMKLWEEIKDSINTVAFNKFSDFNKDYRVIRFDSDDTLPLKETIKIRSLTIISRSVLESDGGYYLQIFLDDCLCEL